MKEHRRRFVVREHSGSVDRAQETNRFRRFDELVLFGQPDHSRDEMTLKPQQVLDACLQLAHSCGMRH